MTWNYKEKGVWNDDDEDALETDHYNLGVEKHNKEVEEIDAYNKGIDDVNRIINKGNSLMAWTMFIVGFALGWLIK